MSTVNANRIRAGGDDAGRSRDRQRVGRCAVGDDLDGFLSLTRDLVLHLDGRIRFQTADANHDVDPVLLDDHADALAGLQREPIVMLPIAVQLTRDRLLRQKHCRVRLGRFDDLSTGRRGDRRYRNARAADEAGEIPPRAAEDPARYPSRKRARWL